MHPWRAWLHLLGDLPGGTEGDREVPLKPSAGRQARAPVPGRAGGLHPMHVVSTGIVLGFAYSRCVLTSAEVLGTWRTAPCGDVPKGCTVQLLLHALSPQPKDARAFVRLLVCVFSVLGGISFGTFGRLMALGRLGNT